MPTKATTPTPNAASVANVTLAAPAAITPAPDMSLPREIVPNITGRPKPYGLFSVATVLEAGSGGHWENGVVFQSDNCTTGDTFGGRCPDVSADKDLANETPTLYGDPFTVTDTLSCGMTSADWRTEAERRVRYRLSLSEEYQVEKTFYTGIVRLTGSTTRTTWPTLAGKQTVVVGSAATPYDPEYGLGLLEMALASSSRVAGVIHMPPVMVPALRDQFRSTQGVLRTVQETPVAVGAGYTLAGPDGVITPGTAWLYATGPVVIRRSEVFVPGTERERFSHATNWYRLIAERVYVIAVDCFGSLAVPVQISC